MPEKKTSEATGDDKDYLNDDFKQWLEGFMEESHLPGMSVAVVDGDEVEAAGFGFARLPNIPATEDTLWNMGSTTKAFTAALVGTFIHDQAPPPQEKKAGKGKLKWSTPVADILPEDFVLSDPYITKHTTIEDILSHRTGLAGHDLLWGPSIGATPEITKSLRHLGPITAPFRGKFQYNNLMYAVAGHIIENLSGQSFPSILKQRILEPLAMRNTYSGVRAASRAFAQDGNMEFARGYYWSDDGGAKKEDVSTQEVDAKQEKESEGYYIPESFIGLGGLGPAGDNISTVKDYARWVQAWLRAAKPPADDKSKDEKSENAQSASPSTPNITNSLFQEVSTPRSIQLPVMHLFPEVTPHPPNVHISPATYGLGWTLNPFVAPGEQVVEHAGGLPGFASYVFLLPNHDFGLVVVGNSLFPAIRCNEAVARELIGRKLGKSKDERRPKKSEKKEENKKGDNKAEEADTKDVPTARSARAGTTLATDTPISDKDTNIVGHYHQPAYHTFAISRTTRAAALSAQKPELDSIRIERKQKYDVNSGGSAEEPLVVDPVSKRGLDYRLMMHNPRKAANAANQVIYDLEMLLRHGDLSDDLFPELKQEFPVELDGKNPLKNEKLWESQKLDKKAAVAVLDDDRQVQKLGLQLIRVDIPEKSDGEIGDDTLEDGWEDRLVWFQKASNQL